MLEMLVVRSRVDNSRFFGGRMLIELFAPRSNLLAQIVPSVRRRRGIDDVAGDDELNPGTTYGRAFDPKIAGDACSSLSHPP